MILVPALSGAAIGAIVGSFIATLCLRWPRGEKVMSGRSKCDGCGRSLGPADLVPIVSALWTRGQCRTCGARIDPLHLQVELAAAAVGGLAMIIAPDARGVALALFGWLLLAPVVLDARHYWLPDRLTLALAAAGLALGGMLAGIPLLDRLIGGGAGFAVLALLAAGYRRARGREGLGAGDSKLLGAIGLWTGWAALPVILLLASLTGLAAAVLQRRGRSEAVAFGSLLACAAWLSAAALLLFPQFGWLSGGLHPPLS